MIKKSREPISIFLMLSLLIHLGAMIGFLLKKARPFEAHSAPVEVKYVTEEELKDLENKKGVKSKPTAFKPTNQVVEQKDRVNDEKDENTRFLSAHDQKVLKQTRAELAGKFNNSAMGGKKEEGAKDGDKAQEKVVEAKKRTKAKTHDAGELPELKDLMPKFSLNPGPRAPDSDKTGMPSQSDDYLKDVNTGMQTLLSTREFVYYSYYQRIKEAIRQHWEPNVRERVKIIYRQGRTIASAKDRVTQVLVTLNAKGELLKVQILTASGVEDLDAAAVDAFQSAQPFPNPPKGMVESDGKIKIRWDFVLES